MHIPHFDFPEWTTLTWSRCWAFDLNILGQNSHLMSYWRECLYLLWSARAFLFGNTFWSSQNSHITGPEWKLLICIYNFGLESKFLTQIWHSWVFPSVVLCLCSAWMCWLSRESEENIFWHSLHYLFPECIKYLC